MESDVNIKEGYKKTAVGVIPDEWEVKKINSVGEVITGSTPKTAQREFYDGDKLFVSPFDITDNVYVNRTEKTLTELGLEQGRLVLKNSILFVSIGSTIGKVAISGEDLITNQQINSIIPFKNIHYYFLYNILKQRAPQIKLMAANQAVPILNKTEFSKIQLPIPPFPEQKAIADCLTTWDSGIEKLSALIKAKKEQKRGLMQQLLTGEKRLDGFEGEWSMKELNEFSKVLRGGSPRPINEYITTNEDGLNWLRIGDIDEDSKYIYTTQEKIKVEGLNKTRMIKEGELILSNSMSFGRPFILKTDCCIHDGWLAITEISDLVDREFLYYLISESHIQSRFEHLAAGSGVRNLNKELISNFTIKLPSINEQKAIAEILDTADKELDLLEKKLERFKEQKRGLMQVLLTGERRLVE